MTIKPILLRFHPDFDSDIIAWLNNVPDYRGAKASEIKEKLRSALSDPGQSVQPGAVLDAESLLADLLPAIRKAVELTVRQELEGLQVATLLPGSNPADDRIDAQLDRLGDILLDDDE